MRALLRLLLPRWRFFEAIGHTYQVYYQLEGSASWILLTTKIERKFSQILWNPSGNFRHAFQSCIEQLALEIPQQPDIAQIVQFHTVQKIIKEDITRKHGLCAYKFKITTLLQGQSSSEEKDLVISDWEKP